MSIEYYEIRFLNCFDDFIKKKMRTRKDRFDRNIKFYKIILFI